MVSNTPPTHTHTPNQRLNQCKDISLSLKVIFISFLQCLSFKKCKIFFIKFLNFSTSVNRGDFEKLVGESLVYHEEKLILYVLTLFLGVGSIMSMSRAI